MVNKTKIGKNRILIIMYIWESNNNIFDIELAIKKYIHFKYFNYF